MAADHVAVEAVQAAAARRAELREAAQEGVRDGRTREGVADGRQHVGEHALLLLALGHGEGGEQLRHGGGGIERACLELLQRE